MRGAGLVPPRPDRSHGVQRGARVVPSATAWAASRRAAAAPGSAARPRPPSTRRPALKPWRPVARHTARTVLGNRSARTEEPSDHDVTLFGQLLGPRRPAAPAGPHRTSLPWTRRGTRTPVLRRHGRRRR